MMVSQAERALRDADVLLWLLDVSNAPHPADRYIVTTLSKRRPEQKLILGLNKADLLPALAYAVSKAYRELCEHDESILISALKGNGIDELLRLLCSSIPIGPRYFPADQLSDANMRFMAAEVIRERVLEHCEQEIPHSVAVEVVSYQEREEITDIAAVIYVERDSQKGILIGRGGSMIKRIGQEARLALEAMADAHIFLDLRVKVQKNWRRDERFLQRLGLR